MIRFYSKQTGRWTDQWSHPALRGYGQGLTEQTEQAFSDYEEAIRNYQEIISDLRDTISQQQETIDTYKGTASTYKDVGKKEMWIGLGLGAVGGLAIGILIGKSSRRKK